jgi:hypothetical protein
VSCNVIRVPYYGIMTWCQAKIALPSAIVWLRKQRRISCGYPRERRIPLAGSARPYGLLVRTRRAFDQPRILPKTVGRIESFA